MTDRRVLLRGIGADEPGILASHAGVLAEIGANIVRTRGVTRGRVFLEEFDVEPPAHMDHGAFTTAVLERGLLLGGLPPAARAADEGGDRHTAALTVVGRDRPGLLADVAAVFHQHSANIVTVSALTIGEQFEITFGYEVAPWSEPLRLEQALVVAGKALGFECRAQLETTSTVAAGPVDEGSTGMADEGYRWLAAAAPMLALAAILAGTLASVATAARDRDAFIAWWGVTILLASLALFAQAFPTERGGPRWDPSTPESAGRWFGARPADKGG